MPYRRFRIRWYALAAVSVVIALSTGLFGWWQVAQAHAIDSGSLHVQGQVTSVPDGLGTYSQVQYTVHGHREEIADLALPADVSVGDPVCLEVSVHSPGDARACGQRYPRPVGVALARFALPISALLLLLAALKLRRLRRLRRAELALRPTRGRRRRRMAA
jgi:hypothetical protein